MSNDIKFYSNGTSLNAIRAYGGKGGGAYASLSANKPVIASASPPTGLLSGGYIDMYVGASAVRSLFFPGGANLSEAVAQSIILRCALKATTLMGMFTLGGPTSSVAPSHLYMYFNANTLNVAIFNEAGIQIGTISGAFTPTIGRLYDIVLCYGGTTAANDLELWVDAVKISSATLSGAVNSPRDLNLIGQLGLGGITFDVAASAMWVDEFAVANYKIVPTAFPLVSGTGSLNGQSRVSPILAPAFDGTSSTDPGVANVRNATAYLINGSAKTGSAVIPAAADVRLGTAVDATTGTLDLPAVGNVKNGTVFDNTTKTGSLVSTDPGIGNVTTGVAYTIEGSAKVGTRNSVTNILQSATLAGQLTNGGILKVVP